MTRLGASVAAACALLAACVNGPAGPSGTDPGDTTTTASATTTTTLLAAEAVEEFRACLDSHGVPVEEVPYDSAGRARIDLVILGLDLGDPEVAAALSECSEGLATGALDLGQDQRLREEVTRELTEYAECMRGWGIDFPDPVPGFTGVGSPFPVAEIPYADPRLPEAARSCRDAVLGALPGIGGDS